MCMSGSALLYCPEYPGDPTHAGLETIVRLIVGLIQLDMIVPH